MIYIRADANSNIGMGHIMRCLSIADAFRSNGIMSTFIVADENALAVVALRGYEAIVLNSAFDDMEAELPLWKLKGILEADIIIVDSYFVTDSYLLKIKSDFLKNGKLVYIDDITAFAYPVDTLVNYNAFAEISKYQSLYKDTSVAFPKLILGPSYAPLRAMFQNVLKRLQPKIVKNILISTGGADKFHLALLLITALKENVASKDYNYHFLIGAMNEDKEQIRKLALGYDNLVIHENVSDMRHLLEGMDLAVSAAGSTLYEICACGVPLITYTIADNQILGAEAFQKLGLAINIGDLRKKSVPDGTHILCEELETSAINQIINAIDMCCEDYAWRVVVGDKMHEIIDGHGAERLVGALMQCI